MTKMVQEIFTSLFSSTKVINTRVSPILNEPYTMSLKLRKIKKKYRFAKHLNKINKKESEKNGTKLERVKKYRKTKGFFSNDYDEYDAEDYYKRRIEL
jgi:hypothetical protein